MSVSGIVHAVQMEISLTFFHQTASARLFPVWKNLHLTAKNTASDAETVAATCHPPPSAAFSVKRMHYETARLDLWTFHIRSQ